MLLRRLLPFLVSFALVLLTAPTFAQDSLTDEMLDTLTLRMLLTPAKEHYEENRRLLCFRDDLAGDFRPVRINISALKSNIDAIVRDDISLQTTRYMIFEPVTAADKATCNPAAAGSCHQ